jgi:hypothetical protein
VLSTAEANDKQPVLTVRDLGRAWQLQGLLPDHPDNLQFETGIEDTAFTD